MIDRGLSSSSHGRQKGAALVISLVLLLVCLMLGVSSMQSSLLDERLAGNYKAAIQAQMGAESAASKALSELGGQKFYVSDLSVRSGINFNDLAYSESSPAGICSENVRCRYDYWEINGKKFIVAMGAVKAGDEFIAKSEPVFVGLGSGVESFHTVLNPDYELTINGNGNFPEDLVSSNSSLFSSAKNFKDFIVSLKESESERVVYLEESPKNGKEFSSYSGKILIVNDEEFRVNGKHDFKGILIFIGKNFRYNGGGNGSFEGLIIHAQIEDVDADVWVWEENDLPNITINGGAGDFIFNKDVLRNFSSELGDEWPERLHGGGGAGISSWD